MRKKSFFSIVFVLLLVSFYASQNMPQGQFFRTARDTIDITPIDPLPGPDICVYQEKVNADKDNCPGNCADKVSESGVSTPQCCDYVKDAKGGLTKKCECKENKNPCDTDEKCTTCAAYAEAGGSNIDDNCFNAVMCAIKNRVSDPNYKPHPATECEAVAQGDGKQFDVYKCGCNANYPNQKYCKCCSDTLTDSEKKEKDEAAKRYKNLDCSGFDADSFNNAGMNSWAKNNCVPVTDHDSIKSCVYTSGPNKGKPVFDFYKCAPSK